MMKRIYRFILVPMLLLILFGCSNNDIKVSFNRIGNLKPKSPVIFESDSVGFVHKIEFLDSNYLVHIKITEKKEFLNYNPYFYLIDSDSDAKIVILDDPSKGFNDFDEEKIFKGGNELDYYLKLFSLKLNEKIDSLKSDERIKELIENLNLKLNELKDKGEEKYEKIRPEIEKNIDEIFEKMKKSFKREEFESLKEKIKKLF
ncbi:MAG: hypothetical protein ABIN11_00960 [candidate division WOR-3 bacterium]